MRYILLNVSFKFLLIMFDIKRAVLNLQNMFRMTNIHLQLLLFSMNRVVRKSHVSITG